MVSQIQVQQCSDLLKKSIRVLIVDDNESVRTLLESFFSSCSLYDVYIAANLEEADEFLEARGTVNVCLMDLGLDDGEGDQFRLLRKYARKMSFIVVTGSRSPKVGGQCRDLGAKDILEKHKLDPDTTLKVVNKWGLVNIICPEYDILDSSTDARAVSVLFENSPSNVTDWARHLQLHESNLRKIWQLRNTRAKYILHLYQLYQATFTVLDETVNESRRSRVFKEWERLKDYFVSHKNDLWAFILNQNN